MNMLDQLREQLSDPSTGFLLLNIALALVLSQVLTWHYLRFAQVLSNKRKFARLFVFLATTTLLVISVVKTSLALSLGLVGALSIIRFRTPIKEPEELAYLFLSIAIGIGLGADQRLLTVIVFTVILLYLTIRNVASLQDRRFRTVLQVVSPLSGGDPGSGEAALGALMPAVESISNKVDLRRVDCHDQAFNASLFIELKDAHSVGTVMSRIQEALPGATVSVVERDSLD